MADALLRTTITNSNQAELRILLLWGPNVMAKFVFRFITNLLPPRYRPASRPSKMVAIVTPISNRPDLTADELISLRHLEHFLGGYDRFLIAPKGLKFQLPGFETRYFSKNFFGSPQAHGRLLYRPEFFREFEDYKYILIYHLDAVVFSDQLMEWCETDLDYIGAPWIPGIHFWVSEPQVGNGGFTLMKVEAVLNVLRERYRMEPARYWEEQLLATVESVARKVKFFTKLAPTRLLDRRFKIRKQLWRAQQGVRHNDLFWSYDAVKYMPTFRVADWRTGVRFAFNRGPREFFELNERKLPFGCHAWYKWDRAFWEPYLIKE